MKKYICISCNWEGTEEELGSIFNSNPHNPEDNTLYEVPCCPECDSVDDLVEDEREYEEEAHKNFYKKHL